MTAKESSLHFVVSNFDTLPFFYLDSWSDVTVYDQSDNIEVIQQLKDLNDPRIRFQGKTCGHNLLNYLDFILDHYEDLPELVVFTKGNMPGRHCDANWFKNSIHKGQYEFLWDDQSFRDQDGIAYRIAPGRFLERNNSWYVKESPHRYFVSFDDFLDFLFVDYRKIQYVLFSPGACYIVERERIIRNPKSFYQGLRKLIDYSFRPAECFMLERALNLIFDRTYELRDYCSTSEFLYQISILTDQSSVVAQGNKNYMDSILDSFIYKLGILKRKRSEKRNKLHKKENDDKTN
jgi:hypothetical protein